MIGYPLDSHIEYDSAGAPTYDRGITSAPLRQLIMKLFSDGVMPNPSTNHQVAAGTGMKVVVQKGFSICHGCMKYTDEATTLTVAAADTLPRIDAVVLRLDDNDSVRSCEFAVVKGTAASSPVAPALTRSESIYEIGLANITIPANSTSILNGNIADTRLNTTRCGYISSISEFDTTTLYAQIQSDLAYFRTEEQARLMAWFNTFIDELTTDQAINLQNQINVLDEKIDNIEIDVLDTKEEIMANTDEGMTTGALATKSIFDSLQASGTSFYFDKQGETFGWNESSARGADTFHPFSNVSKVDMVVTWGANEYGNKTVTFEKPIMWLKASTWSNNGADPGSGYNDVDYLVDSTRFDTATQNNALGILSGTTNSVTLRQGYSYGKFSTRIIGVIGEAN